MTPKQVRENIGKVVEWEGKLWFLLGTANVRAGWHNRPMKFAVIGARDEKHEVPPRSIKLADYPGN